MPAIQIIVVTPEETVVDAHTDFVAIPFFDGEMGIAANHAPLIGRLGCGELRFEADGRSRRYFVDGGFVQIADNVVSIMANRAMPASAISAETAQEQLAAATAEPASGDALALREKKVTQARAMVRVAQRNA